MPHTNKEKIKEYNRKYYLENKEKNKEQHRKYYLENQEKIKEKQRKYNLENPEYTRKYYLENKEKINERHRKYSLENPEKIKEKSRRYQLKNPEKIRATCAKRRSKKLQATPPWLSVKDWKAINKVYSDCLKLEEETGIKHHVDHIIPLQGKNVSGLHVPWNLQILTATENLMKGNRI